MEDTGAIIDELLKYKEKRLLSDLLIHVNNINNNSLLSDLFAIKKNLYDIGKQITQPTQLLLNGE